MCLIKVLKIVSPKITIVIVPKWLISVWQPCNAAKNADGMANSVNSDQTAPKE